MWTTLKRSAYSNGAESCLRHSRNIYFPTYSNGLKEVATYLGFKWSQPGMSGLLSIMWRAEWESSLDPKLKDQLLAYNADDCEAAQRISDTLNEICKNHGANVVQVDSLKREYPQRFGATALAELCALLGRLHSDLKRDKASPKPVLQERTNDTKGNAIDDADEPAVS